MTPYFTPQNPDFQTIELEAIHIASPCRADWEKMRGDDQIRHCASCAKNVYKLSAMTREQAQRLILEKEGNLCVQLHHRADGTVITSDCTVGISDSKKSVRALPRFFAAVFAALLGVFGVQSARAASKTVPAVVVAAGAPMMGEMPALRGEPTMGKPAPLLGRIAPPKSKTQVVKTPPKNHGKHSASNSARRKNKRGAKRH